MRLIYITNKITLATYAINVGADRIMVDLEKIGKFERQGNANTLISDHTIADVQEMSRAIGPSSLLVRINPLNCESLNEIEKIISIGVKSIMMPMFEDTSDVIKFIEFINKRCEVCLLLETKKALDTIEDWSSLKGISEVHVGLNDLHIQLGQNFMFELMFNGVVDKIASVLRNRGIPFGIGGIAPLGNGDLNSQNILMKHASIGSTSTILSRSFHRQAQTVSELKNLGFSDLITDVKRYFEYCLTLGRKQYSENDMESKKIIRRIISNQHT